MTGRKRPKAAREHQVPETAPFSAWLARHTQRHISRHDLITLDDTKKWGQKLKS
jgi:hypothetical protein